MIKPDKISFNVGLIFTYIFHEGNEAGYGF
jgi:hypothetical protein